LKVGKKREKKGRGTSERSPCAFVVPKNAKKKKELDSDFRAILGPPRNRRRKG